MLFCCSIIEKPILKLKFERQFQNGVYVPHAPLAHRYEAVYAPYGIWRKMNANAIPTPHKYFCQFWVNTFSRKFSMK